MENEKGTKMLIDQKTRILSLEMVSANVATDTPPCRPSGYEEQLSGGIYKLAPTAPPHYSLLWLEGSDQLVPLGMSAFCLRFISLVWGGSFLRSRTYRKVGMSSELLLSSYPNLIYEWPQNGTFCINGSDLYNCPELWQYKSG